MNENQAGFWTLDTGWKTLFIPLRWLDGVYLPSLDELKIEVSRFRPPSKHVSAALGFEDRAMQSIQNGDCWNVVCLPACALVDAIGQGPSGS